MKSLRATLCGIFVMAAAGGCGENILTATAKIVGGQMCQLTPNEMIAVNDAANSLIQQQNVPLAPVHITDAQAAALSNFVKSNDLCTATDIQDLQSSVKNGETLQGLDELAAAFGSVDPSQFDVDALLSLLTQMGVNASMVQSVAGAH